MTHIAIDIDGTITAERNMHVFARVCNETWQLGIAEDRLNMLDYHSLFAQPELVRYRQRVGESTFRYELGWIDLDPRVLVSLSPASGAVEGIKLLNALGDVAYYTVRYIAGFPEKSRPMAEATYQWLAAQGFPQAASIVFCESPREKLVSLAEYAAATDQDVLLIDDRYPKLLESVSDFDKPTQALLCRSLTLVAFGAETRPLACQDLRVVPFASWKQIEALIDVCFLASHH